MPDAWVMGVGDSTALRYAGTQAGLSSALVYLRNKGGGSLFLSPGTFSLSSAGLVVDTSNVRIVGSGPATILTAPASGVSALLTLNNAISDVSIESLQLQGQAIDDTPTQIGINLVAASRCTIRNVLFSGASASAGLTTGIDTEDGSDGHLIIGNTFERIIGSATGGTAMLIESSDYNRIIGNRIILSSTQGRHGVYLSVSSNYNIVAHNIIRSGRSVQIQLNAADPQAGCTHNEIYNNICDSMDTAAGATNGAIHILNKCTFNRVYGNRIISSGRHGIHVEASGSVAADSAADNAVDGNYIYQPQQVGIQILGADRTLVKGNTIISANQVAGSYDAINIQRQSTVGVSDTEVVGNIVSGSSHVWAIGIDSGSPVPTGTLIVGNSLAAGSGGFISDNGTGTIGKANIFAGNDPAISVASGATVTLPNGFLDFFTITGTADITSITASWRGRKVTLLFSGTAATNGIVDGSNLLLAGNLLYTPNDTISLVSDGTNWIEAGRSVN